MNTELSIIILAYNEADNLKLLIPRIKAVMAGLMSGYDIVVVDGKSSDGTAEIAESLGCKVATQRIPGYGNAFKQAFEMTGSKYVITVDADCSHNPKFIKSLWEKRNEYQLVIASRYIRGGGAKMPLLRKVLSIILNKAYSLVLSLPYKDLSSGFRLYEVNIVKNLLTTVAAEDFNILMEVLIKIHRDGYNITEIPFFYEPRCHARSAAKIFKFGLSYAKTLYQSWQLRNSEFKSFKIY